MILRRLLLMVVALGAVFYMVGCMKPNLNMTPSMSSKTGQKYSDKDGYAPVKYPNQPTAPGLVFIEGGTFHMGGGEKDIAYAMDNRERQVTVHSFYIDETEISNNDWKEFLFYVSENALDVGAGRFDRTVIKDLDTVRKLYPDTLVWFRELAYNEPFVELYFQNPAFNMYPVVGINWYQANAYCAWRTTFVNDKMIISKSKSQNPEKDVLWPKYRLPTEAEWEYAARGLLEQENYTWEGRPLRNVKGRFLANFKRGRGDFAGRSNKAGGKWLIEGLNDQYMIPAPVKAYWPNDFGLYNMAGNVAEWTFDAYRVLTYEDVEDLNPYRRKGEVSDPEEYDQKYANRKPQGQDPRFSLIAAPDRRSALGQNYSAAPYPETEGIKDRMKVYRGGSWKDIAYYLTCGSRRFFDADSSASYIGFRCAMIRVGSPSLDY